jgi:hypothetical protein
VGQVLLANLVAMLKHLRARRHPASRGNTSHEIGCTLEPKRHLVMHKMAMYCPHSIFSAHLQHPQNSDDITQYEYQMQN